MVIGMTLLVICVLIVAIWVVIEIKRLKHKLFAIFLIGMILFAYISFSLVFKDQETDFKSVPGMFQASKIYFSWLGSIFGNMKSITTHAIHMDWNGNDTEAS
jgi:hypothetical protein